MSEDMVRCPVCGTPHGSIEDATVCCEKVKPEKITCKEVMGYFAPGSAMRLMMLLSIVMALTGVGLILLSYAMGG